MKFSFILIFYILMQVVTAQDIKETRAVWLTTNYQLDWPPKIRSQQQQKESLLTILDDLKTKNINTLFFQVRGSGCVLYYSDIEPMPSFFSWELNKDADYDPLQFVIEEAHKRGIELHAWINMIRVFSSEDNFDINQKKHVMQTHPDWVRKMKIANGTDGWLDPGLPEVQDYLVNIIEELLEKYKIDGVHLDFLRYPGMKFDDQDTFRKYSTIDNIEEWRRNNITEILTRVNKVVKNIDENILVGIAPFGIYKNKKEFWGAESYKEVYQDTKLWIEKGIIDYVVPQIYWNIEHNPKFELVVAEWKKIAPDFDIIAGIGIYKPEILDEVEQQVEIARRNRLEGTAFFRYANIDNRFNSLFSNQTLPFIKNIIRKKNESHQLAIKNEYNGSIEFEIESLNENIDKEEIKYFVLFKSSNDTFAVHKTIYPEESTIKVKIEEEDLVFAPGFYLGIVTKKRDLIMHSSPIVLYKSGKLDNLVLNSEKFTRPSYMRIDNTNYLVIDIPDSDTVRVVHKKNDMESLNIYTKELSSGKSIIELPVFENSGELNIIFKKSEKIFNIPLR